MVFYFTATGNSLYVARRLDPDPISIPQALRREDLTFRDEAIGIVCPDYGSELPYMVRDFLRKARFETDYLYLILTYGSSSGASMELLRQFAEENHIPLVYVRSVRMVDNYLPAFDMEKEKAMDKKLEQQLAPILQDVAEKKHFWERTALKDRMVYKGYCAMVKAHPEMGWKQLKLKAGEGCNGCGICTQVCPAGCIQVDSGRAVHTGEGCQVCLACIHACPQKAIGMSVPEPNPASRYRNPQVTLQDLIAANDQTR